MSLTFELGLVTIAHFPAEFTFFYEQNYDPEHSESALRTTNASSHRYRWTLGFPLCRVQLINSGGTSARYM